MASVLAWVTANWAIVAPVLWALYAEYAAHNNIPTPIKAIVGAVKPAAK